MTPTKDWIFKLSWLLPLLGVWLRIPNTWRALVTALVLACFTSVAVGVYWHATHATQRVPPPVPQQHYVTAVPSAANKLPTMSSTSFYQLTQPLSNLTVTQQRESFSIKFTAKWYDFAEFINQLAHTNLAPDTYRLHWEHAAGAPPGNLHADLQLSPGAYRGADRVALPIADAQPAHLQPSREVTLVCLPDSFPAFEVQATWPSRGYIQILVNGHSARLSLNELLENSWQLLRIGSESVEFRWYSAPPDCPQPETVTVAL